MVRAVIDAKKERPFTVRYAKRAKMQRTSHRYAEKGIKIPRKVAWHVLGYKSPKAYREWRNLRIRHEPSSGRSRNVLLWRTETPLFSRAWANAQPREWKAEMRLSELKGHFLDDHPYTVQKGDTPISVTLRFMWPQVEDVKGALEVFAQTNSALAFRRWQGWKVGRVAYLPSTWFVSPEKTTRDK